MRFCEYCQNATEPDQQRSTDTELYFTCKTCKHFTVVTSQDDFKIASFAHNIEHTNTTLSSVIDDITMPIRKMNCKVPNCQNTLIKFVMDDNMVVTYVCGVCRNSYT
jgi:DNA-directed RNA polymerase subunit M/transcription elongation factor TFIIS